MQKKIELILYSLGKGDFLNAKGELDGDKLVILDMLFMQAYEKKNFSIYGFILFIVNGSESSFFSHHDARIIIEMGFSYLPGAYAAAAYHARETFAQVQQHDPTDDGGLFGIFEYPETPLRADEIVPLARKILEIDPGNEGALQALQNALRPEDVLRKNHSVAEDFLHQVSVGRFVQARELSLELGIEQRNALLLYLGCELYNATAYTFVWYLLYERNDAELHYLAHRIVLESFRMYLLTGCESLALFHIKQAMELDTQNEKYINHYLLLQHILPASKGIDAPSTVLKIAREALLMNKFNSIAARVMKTLSAATL